MSNSIYDLLKEDTGFQVSNEQLQLFSEQNLEYYILSKSFDYPISSEEKLKKLMKRQIEFEIIKIEAVAIAEKFDSMNVDYRFLKGLGVSLTYPNPYTRTMGDFDILVKPDNFEKASKALKEIGYTQMHEDPYSKDVAFDKVGAPHIELHRELFEIRNKDFYTEYKDLIYLLWNSSSNITINDYEIKVPAPQEHFKFLMLHFFKHFKGFGCGVRFLLDIRYFSGFHNIDFNDIEHYFSKGLMNNFVLLIENMLEYYFSRMCSINREMTDTELNNVKIAGKYLLSDGIYGKSSENSEQTNRYAYYKRAFNKSFFSMLQTALFPSRTMLDYRFLYAKKYPILLPIAWGHRFLGFVFGKRSIKDKFFVFNKNDEILESKESVLKQLGYY